MAEVSGGELQTLIATLQNGNVQLGHIFQALGGTSTQLGTLASNLNALAQSSIGGQLGDVEPALGPLPAQPDGFIRVNIPGVGSRLIPYYPV